MYGFPDSMTWRDLGCMDFRTARGWTRSDRHAQRLLIKYHRFILFYHPSIPGGLGGDHNFCLSFATRRKTPRRTATANRAVTSYEQMTCISRCRLASNQTRLGIIVFAGPINILLLQQATPRCHPYSPATSLLLGHRAHLRGQ